MKHTHIAKPKKPLKIGTKWTDIEGVIGGKARKRFYAREGYAGRLTVAAYLPGKYEGQTGARLQVRIVREPYGTKLADPTGYDERSLTPGQDHRLRTHYVGECEPGRRYKVQARVVGAKGTFTTTGSHYLDFWQV